MAEKLASLNQIFKAKIQGLIASNTIRSGGDFHIDELDEDSFIYELNNNFKITPKESELDCQQALDMVIKKSTKKVRGMIDCKEFKQKIFLKIFSETFEIEKL